MKQKKQKFKTNTIPCAQCHSAIPFGRANARSSDGDFALLISCESSGICHVHYPKLAPIVKDTAAEFGIPYHVEPTFWKALGGHIRMLKKLGQE